MSVVNRLRLSGTSTTPALLAAAGRPVFSGVPSTVTVPVVRRQEAGEREQQRGLAGAVRAEEGLDRAGLDGEVDVAERGGRAVARR